MGDIKSEGVMTLEKATKRNLGTIGIGIILREARRQR